MIARAVKQVSIFLDPCNDVLVAWLGRRMIPAIVLSAAMIGGISPARPVIAQAIAWAAPRPATKPPFADPQKFLNAMFEQFLGEGTKDDDQALARVPVSAQEEQRLGMRTAQAYTDELERRKIRVVTRGKDVQYLQELVETIRSQMKNHDRYRKIQVRIVDTASTDAHSVPGGTLFFDRGLLDYAGSEAALVGILGHELSHLDRGHQLKILRRIKLAEQTSAGGKGVSPERFMQSGALLMKAFLRPCSPGDETEADRDGAAWAYEAGYDPRELADLFRRLNQRQPERVPGFADFLRTHPFHLDRQRAIMDLFSQLQAKSPKDKLYIGRENYRRRITRAEREFKE